MVFFKSVNQKIHFSKTLLLILIALFSIPCFGLSLDDRKPITAVSLRSLMSVVESTDSLRPESNDSLLRFYGLTNFDGYIMDAKNRDIVLFGTTSDHPPLHLDDFVDILRNVLLDSVPPYCSLEPNPHSIKALQRFLRQGIRSEKERSLEEIATDLDSVKRGWRGQKIVIRGIPHNSHHSRVMVEADYTMKKASLELVKFPGVQSYLDRFIARNESMMQQQKHHNAPFNNARFWFHLQSFRPEDSLLVPYPHFEIADRIVMLSTCPIVLLTEEEVADIHGKLGRSGGIDSLAQGFATDFSTLYDQLAEENIWFKGLEQLFRLNAMVRAMNVRNDFDNIAFPTDFFLNRYSPALSEQIPDTLPGLVNYVKSVSEVMINDEKFVLIQFPVAFGGIDMAFPVKEAQFLQNHTQELDSLCNKILSSRPDSSSSHWQIGSISELNNSLRR